MAYSQKLIFRCSKSIEEVFKDKVLALKLWNLRKQIFCSECESTSFVKTNLRKLKSNFILASIIFIYSIVVIIIGSKSNYSKL